MLNMSTALRTLLVFWAICNYQITAIFSDEDLPVDYNNDNNNRPTYDIPLDPANRYHLFWHLEYESSEVVFELHARLTANQWFAIGFSDRGNITDADLCVVWWDLQDKVHFQDAWTDGAGVCHVDFQQDCQLMRLKSKNNLVKVMFSRKFDTCDDDDYVIEDGTTHVVYATGQGPLKKLQGLKVIDGLFGFQRSQLLKNNSPSRKPEKGTQSFSITNEEVSVPKDETTYWCSLHKLPIMRKKHHIVQFEAVIQPGHESLVHHMEVFHCEEDSGKDLPDYNSFCSNKPANLEVCKKVLAAWAMGAPPLAYPEEAGLPVGGRNFSPYVMLEIHYNNPELKSDWLDSSGVKFHYTSRLRRFDAAVIEIGLEYTPKMAIPPKQSAFTLSGHCSHKCTDTAIPTNGIYIFASQLHTHLTGIQVFTKHFRGTVEIQELNRDNHYSTHFQEIRILKEPILLLPGDTLINTCTYQTDDRENVTLGGYAIREEMCVNYMHYYPKTYLEVCKSSIDTDSLHDYFGFMKEYEDQDTSDIKTVSENYESIQWTPLRAQMLHELYETAPLSIQCNKSSGDRFPGDWNNVDQLQVVTPLPAPKRECPEGDIKIQQDYYNFK